MTGTPAQDRYVGEGPAPGTSAPGVPTCDELRRETSAGETSGGEVLAAEALAWETSAGESLPGKALAPEACAPGAPILNGSAPIPGPVVVADTRPSDASGVRHPSRRGLRRRWRALRLGVGWAMLVAIGGVAMLPAADALASGVDRPPYIVQQVVASSPTATSQGEGTRRD